MISKPPVEILLLTRYDRLGASSRLRCLDYLPDLQAAGFDITVAPFFDDAYLERRYAGKRASLWRIAFYYLRRLRNLLQARRYDLVWLEKEALPWLPGGLERWLLRRRRLVIDFDDAWFHHYDLHCRRVVRWLLKDKFPRLVHQADLIVAGNDYLAGWATANGAKQVVQIPTTLDPGRYSLKPVIPSVVEGSLQTPMAEEISPLPPDQVRGPVEMTDNKDKFIIGWMGSPSSAPYLTGIAGALATLAGDGTELELVGSGPVELPGIIPTILPWSEDREAALLAGFSVGIMPLTADRWSEGKCAYKLLQYMAAGLPVVASPVGMNRQVVQHGVNGFLAASEAEWVQALTSLRDDPALRIRMGAAGRRLVEELYSRAVNAPKLAAALRQAL